MDLRETQLIESVFAGGGEMGTRMRALDWSTTVLGPVEQWPQSLRACVRIVLGSGHPMLISWGPDYTMLYNDAYGVVVGNKSPGALGRSCREVLAEAWDFILADENKARLASVSVETDEALHPASSTATARACGDSTRHWRTSAWW
jgi:hypothetical protein